MLQGRLKQRFGSNPPDTVVANPGIIAARVSLHGWHRFLLRYTLWRSCNETSWVRDTKSFWDILSKVFARAVEIPDWQIARSIAHRRKQKGRNYQESRYFRDEQTRLWFVLDLYENSIITVLPHCGYMETEFQKSQVGRGKRFTG